MNNLKVGLELKDNGFQQQLAQDKAAISSIGQAAQETSGHLGSLVGDFQKISSASVAEFKKIQKQYQALTIAYREMSDAEQNSAKGQAMAQKLAELRERAAFLKDAIGDARSEITQLSSDTVYWDGLSQGIGLAKSSLEAFVSLTGFADESSEEFKNTIATLTKIETGFNAVIAITNALQKNSALMTAIAAVKTAAATAATKLNTAAKVTNTAATVANTNATKSATVAQAAFNLVAKANPYVLLATALITVGAAIYGFIKYTNEATEAEKRAQKEAEALKKKQEELRKRQDELSSSAGKVKASFWSLQAQWKSLKTEADKKKWIEDNKSAFSSLGITVNQVKTAEDIFVNNTDAVVNALIARAVAAKKAEQAAEDLINLEKRRGQKSRASGDYYTKANRNNVTDAERKELGISSDTETVSNGMGGYYLRKHELTEAELDKVNKLRAQKAAARRRQVQKQYDDEEKTIKEGVTKAAKAEIEAEAALAKLGDKPKGKSGGHRSTGKPEKKAAANSRQDLKNRISAIDEKLTWEVDADDTEAIDKLKAAKKELQKELDELEIKLGYKEDPETKQGLSKLKEELSELEKKRTSLPIDADPTELVNEIEAKKKEIEKEEIRLKIKADPQIELEKKYNDAVKPKEKSSFDKAIGEEPISLDNYDAQLDKIQEQMDANDELLEKLREIRSQYEALGLEGTSAYATINDKIGEVNENQAKLGENAKNVNKVKKESDKVGKSLQLASQAGNAFGNALSTLGSSFGDNGLQIAGIIAQAIAELVGQYAAVPKGATVWDWAAGAISGAATLASVIAQIHSISGYANGGIIQGSSTMGDHMIARVNAGEMILNTRQQANLFRMLNGELQNSDSNIPSGHVEFKIDGKQLVGVLNNYTTSKNKLR